MKKIAIFLLAMLMIVSLIGCSTQTAADPDPVDEPAVNEGTTNTYNDGTYEAYDDAAAKSFHKVVVTIKDDKIVDLELIGFRNTGDVKDADYAYAPFHEAQSTLTEAFLAANGTEGAEVITGATGSSEGWAIALDRALEKALVEPASDAAYFNGTFQGVTELGERGRKMARVTIENDKIVDVVLEETRFVDDAEVLKDEEYDYAPFHGAVEEMPARFIEANGTDVETFTGATSSSTGWIEAIEDALAKAAR
ncbi:hypothetical protein CACET_c06310 [Clostridium aceticum]|uniref:Uncharacterized protein n=1 Tax=Clostridium aceticum TaxID=84022 RepID=A0A0D8IH58_9CLOT|nr:FMN-binding protein [Clostridium aceticum]AKL94141.1 hypothetical protein CACET_c06310 [Clostridium aceticum]KJF28511.1 hypothetical protein TZ02_00870 [Clostridium aceticum]